MKGFILFFLFCITLTCVAAPVFDGRQNPRAGISPSFLPAEGLPPAGAPASDSLCAPASVHAPADALSRARQAEIFRPSALILPGAIFTAGAAGISWDFYAQNINNPIRNYAGGLWSQWGKTKIDEYLQYAPIVSFVVLGALGAGDHGFTEQLLAGATAYATMGALVNGLKYTVCEMRPDASRRNSFPSGHSATAFMGAELVRIEYGPWWGAGAYTVATSVALMRVYNNRHWFNDLLGGAAIGILSARVAWWLLPWERRVLGQLFGCGSSDGPAFTLLPFAAPTFTSAIVPSSANQAFAPICVPCTPAGPVSSSVMADPVGHLSAYGLSLSLRF